MTATSKADVFQRHKDEWRKFHKTLLAKLIDEPDADAAKTAKAIADVLKVYQEGELKAWDYQDTDSQDNSFTFAWEE